MTFLSRLGLRILTVLLAVTAAIFLLRAMDSQDLPDLGPEHRIQFDSEFTAPREHQTDWKAYLAIEDALAGELETRIQAGRSNGSKLDRYAAQSLTYPGRFDGNWNRSYELAAAVPRGVAVLLHGLSDSPYSMLATAEALVGAGFNVVVPRMPGHGFAVGGLLQARQVDWAAAVRIAVRHAIELPAGDQSLVMVGYSNGALTAIDYALYCTELGMRCPDRLILISPAIAVTPLAAIGNWHSIVSWTGYFEKFGWVTILPEIDPFKFTSFPKRAGWELHKMSQRVHRRLRDPVYADQLPPVLTFQSIVDDTVRSIAVVEDLHQKLPAKGSKVLVYDINRNNTVVHLLRDAPYDAVKFFEDIAPLKYDVSILRNRNNDVLDVDEVTLAAGETAVRVAATGLRWPESVYSLSHIALPFRPDDPLYGDGRRAGSAGSGIAFGTMAPRGERNVLLLPPDFFLRVRHNPFHAYQSTLMIKWLTAE